MGRPKFEQAQGFACGSEVVAALREMHVAQRADDLEFDDDTVLDQQVGGKFADDNVVVKDDDPPMLDGAEPVFRIWWARASWSTFSTNP